MEEHQEFKVAPARRNKGYSIETKLAVIRDVLGGMSLSEASRQHKISLAAVHRWSTKVRGLAEDKWPEALKPKTGQHNKRRTNGTYNHQAKQSAKKAKAGLSLDDFTVRARELGSALENKSKEIDAALQTIESVLDVLKAVDKNTGKD